MASGHGEFGRDTTWRFGEGGDRRLPRNALRRPRREAAEERACDGWPEIGACGRPASRGGNYCAECDEARRAHEGTANEDELDD